MRRGRRALAAAVGLAALTTGGVAIAAAPLLGTSPVPGQSIGSATASCKKGKAVVAPGFEAPDFTAGDDAATVARISSKLVGKRSVTTDAFNFGAQQGSIVSRAYCKKWAKAIRVKSDSTVLSPGSSGDALGRCPRHSKVLAGGFEAPDFSKDGARVIVFTSMRATKRSWAVEGFNIPPDDNGSDQGRDSAPRGRPGTLTAYAYCMKRGPKLATELQQSAVPGPDLVTVDAQCSNGAKAISGGFDGNLQPSGADVSASAAVTSMKAPGGRAWRIVAVDVSENVPASATAYAYCRAKGR